MRVQLNETFYKNRSYTHRYDDLAAQVFTAYPTGESDEKGIALYLLVLELVNLPQFTLPATEEEFDVIS
jgi:hypothetical protein